MSATSGRSILGSLAAVAIAVAGVVHIIIVPQHYQHAPAHGVFFLVAGIVEIAWSIAFIWKPSKRLTYVGMGIGSMLLVLWLLTRALPAPFGHSSEVVDAWAIVCKLSEFVGVVALVLLALLGIQETGGRRAGARAIVLALALGLVFGLTTYAVARAAEPLFPGLAAADEGEHHEQGDAAGGTEGHDHPVGDEHPEEHGHEPGEAGGTVTP
jgi:hypothetical protein